MALILVLAALVSAQVEISLESGWKGYSENSLKQELSEYFAEIGFFWEFISQNLTVSLENLIEANSRSALEKKVIYSSLYNREFSPRLEFYSSLELSENATCSPFFVINSVVTCSLDAKLAEVKIPIENNFDHVLYPREGSLIAYVNIASSSFLTLHSEIIAFTEEHDLSYVIRHADTRSDEVEKLGGYGAFLSYNLDSKQKKNSEVYYKQLPDYDTFYMSQILIEHVIELETLHEVVNTFKNLPSVLPDLAFYELENEIKPLSQEKNILTINGYEVKPTYFNVLRYLREEVVPFTLLMNTGFNYATTSNLFMRVKNELQSPKHDDRFIAGNPMITSIANRYIQVSPNVPTVSFGETMRAVCFIYVVLSQNDQSLAKIALKAKEDYATSPVQIKFVFNFHDLSEDWLQIICKILPKNCDKNYVQDQIHKSVTMVQSLRLCESCVIVNSRVIEKKYFTAAKDFYVAYQTENKRMNIDDLKNIISDKSLLEKSIHVLLKYAKGFYLNKGYSLQEFNGETKFTSIYPAASKESYFLAKFQVDITSHKLAEILEVANFMQKLGAEIKVTYVWSVDWKLPVKQFSKFFIKESFEDAFVFNFKDNSYLYSLLLNVPDNWIARVSQSYLNLNCFDIVPKKTVKYSLKNILIKGSASLLTNGEIKEAPHVRLSLYHHNKLVSETNTVPTTGYYQFKSFPGLFEVKMNTKESQKNLEVTKGKSVVVKDFITDPSEIILSDLEDFSDTINVFFHASGTESERFAKVLIKSIMEHTSAEIKFFILEDTLQSSNLFESVKILQEKYQFQYEFVSFSWPSWMFDLKDLRKVNMAYRSIFADLLLPLSVNKVIVINPDSYFKGDIKEIWDYGMQKNTFAMFPLERFNSDWWTQHLKDKPYHTACLIVIDLKQYRASLLGNKLRTTVNFFIPDKNNLAILDQDLLNYYSVEFPITTLPNDWIIQFDADDYRYNKNLDSHIMVNFDGPNEKFAQLKKLMPFWFEEEQTILKIEKNWD